MECRKESGSCEKKYRVTPLWKDGKPCDETAFEWTHFRQLAAIPRVVTNEGVHRIGTSLLAE